MLLPSVTVCWYQLVYKQDQKHAALVTLLVVNFSFSFQLQIKQDCDVLASCEPAEMVQLGRGSGNCISVETAVISCTTHGRPNLLLLVFEYCASPVTHCHGSLSHELHCWLLGDINDEPLTVPVECTSVSYWVIQNSSRGCGTPHFFTVFKVHLSRTVTFSNSTCN